MAELRRDPIVGQWVIVHTDDSWGPTRFDVEAHRFDKAATCQFCPGREHMTPPEVSAIRFNGAHPNSSGWQVRVVPNKFPALRIEGNFDEKRFGVFETANGIGAHEVLIEGPDHKKNLADFTQEEIVYVLDQYQNRVVDLARDKRFKYIVIFKNYGESAGATVEHAHSQIIALPMVPKYVAEELRGAENYYAKNQRCIFCDLIEQEKRDQARIVAENESFIAFCPFVPRYAFEFWILPKAHHSEFSSMTIEERLQLAKIFKETLQHLKSCLSDPSYNYYLHISPVNHGEFKSFHWHLEIIPKLTRVSGFEWGTGFYVVRTEPGMAAKFLREAKV